MQTLSTSKKSLTKSIPQGKVPVPLNGVAIQGPIPNVETKTNQLVTLTKVPDYLLDGTYTSGILTESNINTNRSTELVIYTVTERVKMKMLSFWGYVIQVTGAPRFRIELRVAHDSGGVLYKLTLPVPTSSATAIAGNTSILNIPIPDLILEPGNLVIAHYYVTDASGANWFDFRYKMTFSYEKAPLILT